MNQLTLDQEVDAFWAEKPQRPAAPLTARITCRVCDRKEDVPIPAAGLLCVHCRADLDATERHIRETLATTEQALHDTWASWDADLAHADPTDQERYQKVCAAKATGNGTDAFEARYQRAWEKGDGLSALLRSAAQAETALKAMEHTQAWADA